MAGAPLPPGTRVRVLPPFSGGEGLSEETAIAAVQWVAPDGTITDEQQDDFQYLLDAEEPFPDVAMRPEYVEEVG